MKSNDKTQDQVWKITSVITFYMTVSMALVFLNKYILTYSVDKFSFPVFTTWFQIVVAFIAIYTLGNSGIKSLTFIGKYEFNKQTARKVLPLTLIYVGMLATNNLCLNYLEVSYFQIARSLSVCVQVMLSWYILGEKNSMKALYACMVIIIGFLVSSESEANFSWRGLLFGVLSSIFVALYSTYVKKVLKEIGDNEWYNTTMSLVLLLPWMLVSGELTELFSFRPTHVVWFWTMMILAGLLGFLINIAVFLQIKVTSPLTSVITGATKSVLQTLLSIILFKNTVGVMNCVGMAINLTGSTCYAIVRYTEMKKRNAKMQMQDKPGSA